MHIKVSPKVNGKRRLGEAFNEAPSPREPGQMVISGLHNLMSSCDPGQQATSPMTVDLDVTKTNVTLTGRWSFIEVHPDCQTFVR
jgi:hypothetical protein